MPGTDGPGSGARTATASVLVADVVGSTELRARLGEESADALSRRLEARIGELIADHHGQVIKGLGDGVLAVFDSAVDAVGASVAVQQDAELTGRKDPAAAVELRVGLSSGDVSFDAGDVLGSPVVEASRLCSTAQAGQILVADVVRTLSRGRGSFLFESVGELSLRGLPEPVPACQVVWEPLEEQTTDHAPLALPGLLAAGVTTSYVGRTDLLGRLSDLWSTVTSNGGARAALLSGEPGVGKTRTCSELARAAHREGAVVLYGSCSEDLGVPFQPFVEALDFYTGHHADPRLGRLAGELARLCPEVPTRVEGLPAAVISDPQTEEYRLFEAVTSWLIDASKDSGLLLVLDDLHWATRATLLLLSHLLKGAGVDHSGRLMVLGTYRDTELDRAHPLTSVLADLRRIAGVERIDLRGLSLEETLTLVQSAAGHQLDPASLRLAEATYSETEGNPFFIGEMVRHFVETGRVRLVDGRWQVTDPGVAEVPEGVRDVLGRRLARLSDTANQVLRVAAVIGRDFDLDLLSAVSDVDDMALIEALDEASRARMIEESGPESYRFFHAMVRETLYQELSGVRRRRTHQAVVDVLEKLRPADAVTLAHHAVEAGPTGGDMGRAVLYLLQAAADALAARDLPGSELYYRQAIELIDHGQPDPVRRLEALCGTGEAERDQGKPEFRQTLLDATRAALELHRPELAARAAVANFRGMSSVVNGTDTERVEVLEATLSSLGDERTARAALVAATLSAEINYDRRFTAAYKAELAEKALQLARVLGDQRVLAEVLTRTLRAQLVPSRSANAPELMVEALSLADALGDPTLAALARVYANAACVGVGEIDRAGRYVEEALNIASKDCPPFVEASARANKVQHLLYHGHLDEAARTNDEFLAYAQHADIVDAEQWWAANVNSMQFLRGALADIADLSGEFADSYPAAVAWRCGHAVMLSHAGRLAEAEQTIRTHRLDDPATFPVDDFILSAWAYLGLASVRLGDAALGQAVEKLLRPHQHLWVSYQVFTIGPALFPLAGAVAAQDRYDEALDLFDRTDAMLAMRGLDLHRNAVRLELVHALRRSPSPAHRARAVEETRLGMEVANATGLDRLYREFAAVAVS